MRIAVFSNFDLYSNLAINFLLDELRMYDFKLFLTYNVGANKPKIPPLKALAYFETDFVVNHLFPFIEKNETKGFASFGQISKEYDAELSFVNKANDPEFISKLRIFNPDLIVVIRFGQILKGEIVSIPAKGIVNLHSAKLPYYRGVMGTFRALQMGEKNIGATIHFIADNTIDTGPIIKIINLPVHRNHSVLWHTVSLYPVAVNELKKIIKMIADNEPIATEPQPKDGSYFSFPTQHDFELLKKKSIPAFNQEEYAELLGHYYKIDKDWVMKTISQDKDADKVTLA